MEFNEPLVTTLTEWIELFMRRSMRNLLLYSKQNGLSITQIAVLFLIQRKGTSSVSDIGDDLEITNPAASQMLERLVQLRLITRSEDPSDRRVKLIVLTDKGRQILQEGNLANRNWLEDLARSMTDNEQEQVRDAVLVLIEKARQLETIPN
jgi:DNA-binding MarR family transcriptional regulator